MPGAVWEEALEVATRRCGYITPKDVRRLGADPALLRQWLRRGSVKRVCRGVYRFEAVPESRLDPYMLATLWPAGKGVLSHETALELHGLRDVNPCKIHITLPPAASYRPIREGGEMYEVHHQLLHRDQITSLMGISIVTPEVAVEQCSRSSVSQHLIEQLIGPLERAAEGFQPMYGLHAALRRSAQT